MSDPDQLTEPPVAPLEADPGVDALAHLPATDPATIPDDAGDGGPTRREAGDAD